VLGVLGGRLWWREDGKFGDYCTCHDNPETLAVTVTLGGIWGVSKVLP